MAGSPLKRLRRDIVREAVMRAGPGGDRHGEDPVDVMLPYVERLKEIALGEDAVAALSALKEIFDRVDGKVTQRVEMEGSGSGGLVDLALVGAAGALLKEVRASAGLPHAAAERDMGEAVVVFPSEGTSG